MPGQPGWVAFSLMLGAVPWAGSGNWARWLLAGGITLESLALGLPVWWEDPVCGRLLPSEQVVAWETYRGQTYAFCSRTCQERFAHHPARYRQPA